MAKTIWMLLNYVATYNEVKFSLLVDVKKIKLRYDILDLVYVLSTTVYWFVSYNKRRENEQISIMRSTIDLSISIDKINTLPYFVKNIHSKNEDDFIKEVITLTNNNKELLSALVLKYQDEIGSRLYIKGGATMATVYDRFSSYSDLTEQFKKLYVDDTNTDIITNEVINSCII